MVHDTAFTDNQAIRDIRDLIRESKKQTILMIILTVILVILTLVLLFK